REGVRVAFFDELPEACRRPPLHREGHDYTRRTETDFREGGAFRRKRPGRQIAVCARRYIDGPRGSLTVPCADKAQWHQPAAPQSPCRDVNSVGRSSSPSIANF